MESWSSQIDTFKIKIFLDTNILCYLVDNTYPALNQFIERLGEIPLVDLISSEFVLTEFVGVRKQEHYFREALKKGEKNGIQINFSSLIKNNKRYDIPNLSFDNLKEEIYDAVKFDEGKITSDYKISFSSGFNRSLLKPTSDICLTTKISKEDSLVLASAVFYEENRVFQNKTLLLTNDNDFHSWYSHSEKEIDAIFVQHSAESPLVEHLDKFANGNLFSIPVMNFTKPNGISINDYTVKYIKSLFVNEFRKLFIGKVFQERCSLPLGCICFKGEVDIQIPNKSYVVIIDKDLNFIYCTKHKVSFWNKSEITTSSFSVEKGYNELSFMISDSEITAEIIRKLKNPDNLIFIHPDN